MSAVKHQPATPLPHKVGPLAGSIYAESGIEVAKMPWPRRKKNLPDGYRTAEQRIVQNAAYLAHAANAYPKLVEALHLVANGMVDRATLCKESAALLREIGEAS